MSNKIICNNYTFTGDDISEANCFIGNSLAGDELSVDTLEATVVLGPAAFTTSDGNGFQTSDGIAFMCANPITGYEYGDVVKLEHNEQLMGKFHFEKSSRRSRAAYDFFCMSAIGLLDNVTHYGGLYTEVTAGVIIADILGDIPHTIAADVAAVTMGGWLPVAKCRDNLQQVLFAVGAGVFKDSAGDMVIRYIEASTPAAISDDRIYMEGSIDYQTPCTRVDVTEHAYYALTSDKVTTLFDTASYVTEQIITFDKPCHTLVATGLTIVTAGVNYAIVTGAGKLTGKEYTHTKNVMSYAPGTTGKPYIVSVTDATLVSTFNSWNVARRVLQYYSSVSVNSIGLVVGDERPTTEIAFTDTFGDPVSGYIKSMAINLSTTLKADTDVAIGFLPTGQGNNYNNFVQLTGRGTWDVPAGVERIHIILVGGGQGGGKGSKGSDASGLNNANGGPGGPGGSGGKIFISDLTVVPGQQIPYICGNGGFAAPTQDYGEPTTFAGRSSTNGVSYSGGYAESKTGLALAVPGSAGIAGGKAGNPTENKVYYNFLWYSPGSKGLATSGGGYWAFGGVGGGAAAGSHGNAGHDAMLIGGQAFPGMGGLGATPVNGRNATDYGAGGGGGHGGGGGGGGGETNNPGGPPYGGLGGNGSYGGQGGPGLIIIYY